MTLGVSRSTYARTMKGRKVTIPVMVSTNIIRVVRDPILLLPRRQAPTSDRLVLSSLFSTFPSAIVVSSRVLLGVAMLDDGVDITTIFLSS